jgi:hypothetical protein
LSGAPQPDPGRFGEFEQVAEVTQVYEAELIVLRLQAEGLRAELVDQTFHQEPMPNVRAFSVVRVLVPLADAERARALLSAHAGLPEDGEEHAGESD